MTLHITADAALLEEFVGAAQTIVSEAKVRVDGDGISLRAVDPANVAMVDLEVDADALEALEAGDGHMLGVNLGRLAEFLAMTERGDLVELELEAETRKLSLRAGALDMTMALIDPDAIRQEPDIPDLDLSTTVIIAGSDLRRMVSAADLVSDHIALGMDGGDEVLYGEAEGDTDDVRLEVGADDAIAMSETGDAHSLFSLDYLKDLKTPVPSDAEVSVRVGEEFPVKLRYTTPAGVSVENMVAPRTQSE